METEKRILETVASVPLKAAFARPTALQTARQLSQAGAGHVDADEYLGGALALSALFSLCALCIFLFLLDTAEALAAFLLSFALSFLALFRLPALAAMRRRKAAEAELPFLLRELAVYVDIGIPFEKALQRAAKSGYEVSPELADCCSEIRSGATAQQSLARLSAKSGSMKLKRACLLLSAIYETGAGGEQLRRAAEEMSSQQLSEMRLQSGRFSLLAVGFIALSALLPSFFTVYAALAPFLASESVAGWQVWAAFLLAFPLLDAGVLCAMLFILPPLSSSKKREGTAAGKSGRTLVCAAIASVLIAAALFHFGFAALSALALAIAPCAYFMQEYASQSKIAESEQRLPDALYSAASTHRMLSAERMLSLLAKGGFGRVSEAFEIALGRMKAGEKFESALAASARHCPSALVERAFSLLIVSYQTGADMYSALREAAQDTVFFFAIVRERAALLSVQRYTILLSCALLVPAILGAVACLAPSLSSASSFSGAAGGIATPSLLLACQCYLAANALLCSLFLGIAENMPPKAALYFALCAPVSEAVFLLVSSGAALA
jgi:pilus assembly protein TadC